MSPDASTDSTDFFEHGSLALHVVDAAGTILKANQAELDLLGYASEEYVGRNIAEFHADAGVIAALLRRLTAGERVRDYPARLRCKDGSLRHVLINSRVRFQDGEFMHTRCFTRDVTGEETVRREATKAQRRLAFLADATAFVTASLDHETILQRISRVLIPEVADWSAIHLADDDDETIRLVAIAHGDPAREAFARDWLGRYPVSRNARFGIPVVMRTGEPSFRPQVAREILERAARTPDDLQALLALGIRSSIVVPLAARGHTFGTITVMTAESGRTLGPDDVTFMEEIGRLAALAVDNARLYERAEAARAEAQVASEASQRLAAIVTNSEDAIISKTLDGIITSWNTAAEKMFGQTAAEAIGRHIMLIIPEERRSEEDLVIASIRRGERVDHFDTIRVTKDGRLVDISLTVSPIRDAGGRVVGASKTARDISERRRLEEERRQLLAREQAARAEAEAVSRAKDEFLATVSHELRTPLSGVYGWARMLQSSEMDETTRQRAVAAIVRNATAQTRLIEDLLDVSRAVSGNMRLEMQPVELRAVIEAALDAVRPAAIAKTLELVTDFAPQEAIVLGAADRLQQVVWNLVMNGVKFTPRGGRIEVRLRRTETDAEIVVTDSGEGIGADVLPYVFDRFRQEDSSSTRAHSGLGLGLTVVRHMIDLHGGAVTAESPGKGKGATFTVRLPLATARPSSPPSGTASPDRPASPGAP